MLDKLFRDHPRSVGETYGEHFVVASGFAAAMLLAGLACLVHAVIPGLCVRTGSRTVEQLYERMVMGRTKMENGAQSPPA